MYNKTFLRFAFMNLLVALVAFAAPAQSQESDAKKVFATNKCNTCHSIESQAIKKTLASSKAPDLSNIGSTRKADWLTKYLKKEEAKDNKKHVKGWTGSKEDLETLVKWLETLKAGEKK